MKWICSDLLLKEVGERIKTWDNEVPSENMGPEQVEYTVLGADSVLLGVGGNINNEGKKIGQFNSPVPHGSSNITGYIEP